MSVRIPIATDPPYEVVVGPGALGELERTLAGASACAVVTDENVARLQHPRLGRWSDAPLVVLPAGEDSKSFERLEAVLDALVAASLDRGSVLIALGGGVVGDLAGLAASLYMRGIGVVQCPTTLLSQVDASVGGKTAVNLKGGKNLAGTFHQPRAVLADTATLATLPSREFASGLGEVLKSALVGDPELLELLERSTAELLAREPSLLARVVERCVRVKGAVVAEDERESGRRQVLNLGHTFAHAIEHVAGYGAIPHGMAVATGLVLALRASEATGRLRDDGLPTRVERLLDALQLPGSMSALRRLHAAELPAAALTAALRTDKKGRAGTPRFVLPRRLGELELGVELEAELLERLWQD